MLAALGLYNLLADLKVSCMLEVNGGLPSATMELPLYVLVGLII